ncbi:unnamed protein product, partial [Brenthis ino]
MGGTNGPSQGQDRTRSRSRHRGNAVNEPAGTSVSSRSGDRTTSPARQVTRSQRTPMIAGQSDAPAEQATRHLTSPALTNAPSTRQATIAISSTPHHLATPASMLQSQLLQPSEKPEKQPLMSHHSTAHAGVLQMSHRSTVHTGAQTMTHHPAAYSGTPPSPSVTATTPQTVVANTTSSLAPHAPESMDTDSISIRRHRPSELISNENVSDQPKRHCPSGSINATSRDPRLRSHETFAGALRAQTAATNAPATTPAATTTAPAAPATSTRSKYPPLIAETLPNWAKHFPTITPKTKPAATPTAPVLLESDGSTLMAAANNPHLSPRRKLRGKKKKKKNTTTQKATTENAVFSFQAVAAPQDATPNHGVTSNHGETSTPITQAATPVFSAFTTQAQTPAPSPLAKVKPPSYNFATAKSNATSTASFNFNTVTASRQDTTASTRGVPNHSNKDWKTVDAAIEILKNVLATIRNGQDPTEVVLQGIITLFRHG